VHCILNTNGQNVLVFNYIILINVIYALLIISWQGFGLPQHERENSIYFWHILCFHVAFHSLYTLEQGDDCFYVFLIRPGWNASLLTRQFWEKQPYFFGFNPQHNSHGYSSIYSQRELYPINLNLSLSDPVFLKYISNLKWSVAYGKAIHTSCDPIARLEYTSSDW